MMVYSLRWLRYHIPHLLATIAFLMVHFAFTCMKSMPMNHLDSHLCQEFTPIAIQSITVLPVAPPIRSRGPVVVADLKMHVIAYIHIH